MALYDVFDEAGTRLELADLPSSRAARGEEAEPLLVRNVIRATGEERWLLHKATPVYDPDGSLSLIVSVIEDLTEVKRAELAQRLLAEAGQELSSSLDYEHTLQRVARLTVPGLADWCAVVMRGDGDALRQVAVARRDAGRRDECVRARNRRRRGDPTPGGRRDYGRDRRPAGARRPAADRRADAGDGGVRPGVRRDRRWRSPPSSGAAPRSRSRTRGCTPSAPRSRPRCSGACCRPTCPRSPGSGSRASTAPPASRTTSAVTSTTRSRSPGAGWWSSATWPGAAPRRRRSRRCRATRFAPPASCSEIRSRRSSSSTPRCASAPGLSLVSVCCAMLRPAGATTRRGPTSCSPAIPPLTTCSAGPRGRSACSRRSSAPTSAAAGRRRRSGSSPATNWSSTPTE